MDDLHIGGAHHHIERERRDIGELVDLVLGIQAEPGVDAVEDGQRLRSDFGRGGAGIAV